MPCVQRPRPNETVTAELAGASTVHLTLSREGEGRTSRSSGHVTAWAGPAALPASPASRGGTRRSFRRTEGQRSPGRAQGPGQGRAPLGPAARPPSPSPHRTAPSGRGLRSPGPRSPGRRRFPLRTWRVQTGLGRGAPSGLKPLKNSPPAAAAAPGERQRESGKMAATPPARGWGSRAGGRKCVIAARGGGRKGRGGALRAGGGAGEVLPLPAPLPPFIPFLSLSLPSLSTLRRQGWLPGAAPAPHGQGEAAIPCPA